MAENKHRYTYYIQRSPAAKRSFRRPRLDLNSAASVVMTYRRACQERRIDEFGGVAEWG
jgi:hypothetical protein